LQDLYESSSEDELDEACELAFNQLVEDKEGFFRSFDIDEDASAEQGKEAGAGKANAAAQKLSSVGNSVMKGVDTASKLGLSLPAMNVATIAKSLVLAGGVGLALGAAAGAGYLLYKFIKKRRELKKALSGIPDGPKKDALREQYKKMSMSEIQQMSQINTAKAKMQGAKAAAAGSDSNPPKEEPAKSSYEEGYTEGKKALEQAKKIKEMPKEKREEKGKELAAKVESVKSAADKLKGAEKKLKELKK
jgi:hypothetical protein